MAKGGLGKRWTDADDSSIQTGIVGGRSAAEIGKLIGRTPGSVRKRACQLGLKWGGAVNRRSTETEAARLLRENRARARIQTAQGGSMTPAQIRAWLESVMVGDIEAGASQIASARAYMDSWRKDGGAVVGDEDRVPRQLLEWWTKEESRRALQDFMRDAGF